MHGQYFIDGEPFQDPLRISFYKQAAHFLCCAVLEFFDHTLYDLIAEETFFILLGQINFSGQDIPVHRPHSTRIQLSFMFRIIHTDPGTTLPDLFHVLLALYNAFSVA